MAKCPSCGKSVDRKDSFCKYCGSILDFELKGNGINNSHLCESHNFNSRPTYTRSKSNYKKSTTQTVTKDKQVIKAMIALIIFVVFGVIASVAVILFNTIEDIEIVNPVYEEEITYHETYEINELIDLFPEYETMLYTMEEWSKDTIMLMNKHNIAPYMPYYVVDLHESVIECMVEANYHENSYFGIKYNIMTGDATIVFTGEERGQTFEDIIISLDQYPIIKELGDIMVDVSLYQEALNLYDSSKDLGNQMMKVYKELTYSSYDSCEIFIHEDEQGYFMEVEINHIVKE